MVGILLNALVPVFVGLLLGFAAGLRGAVDNKNVKSLVTFLMSFALPCSLFSVIARTPHELLRGQVAAAVVLALVYVSGFLATFYISRKAGRDSNADSAVLALTLGFPNSAAVGIPLLHAVKTGILGRSRSAVSGRNRFYSGHLSRTDFGPYPPCSL